MAEPACELWPDDQPCGESAVERLEFCNVLDENGGIAPLYVCAEHLAEHLREHLLVY